MAQINLQGQITIPPELQAQLGLQPGTDVQLEVVGSSLT
jgi:bifunctional DNA-binding transcriptional regulator/antitoxin component of YhaV-PrlF toxin-antitoxin module